MLIRVINIAIARIIKGVLAYHVPMHPMPCAHGHTAERSNVPTLPLPCTNGPAYAQLPVRPPAD